MIKSTVVHAFAWKRSCGGVCQQVATGHHGHHLCADHPNVAWGVFRDRRGDVADVSVDGVQVFGWDSVLLSLLTYVTYPFLSVRFADQRYGLRMRIVMAIARRRINGDGNDKESAVKPWMQMDLDPMARFNEACRAAPLF